LGKDLLRSSEKVAFAFLVYLVAAATVTGADRRRRLSVGVSALVLSTIVLVVSTFGPAVQLVRDWAPGVYMLAGYWLPGRLVSPPNLHVELYLAEIDRRVLGCGMRVRLPPVVRGYLEAAYLVCYPLIPVSLGIAYAAAAVSDRGRVADTFWTVVLLAVYPCYGTLPWLHTRPPRSVPRDPCEGLVADGWLRRLNCHVLQSASVGANTFPSAHVASAVGAALAVWSEVPVAGMAVGLLALSIAVASVLGRYHYLLDAVLGVVCGVIAWLCCGNEGV
jgi:hypothetical protein